VVFLDTYLHDFVILMAFTSAACDIYDYK